MTSDILEIFLTNLNTYPNQILYYISLFIEIRLPTYLKIWRHMWMLPYKNYMSLMNAHCPFGPLETMTVLRASESSLGRFWCEMSFRFISIFIASFFLSRYLVVCKLFANRCTILRGVFTIFRLIKKTGQDNSYMHLSGANFWHLIFRPNFKVVDIINDIFRNGRNSQL